MRKDAHATTRTRAADLRSAWTPRLDRPEERSSAGLIVAAGTVLSRFRYYRILGRFHRLRRLIAALRGLSDSRTSREDDDAAAVASWVDELRARGFCTGPHLSDETVAAICRFASARACCRPGDREQFLISEVRNGRTPGGAAAAVADVRDPMDCPEIGRLARAPRLIGTAARLLGYRPRRTKVRLYWSPVADLSDGDRREAGQTIDFHYDIEACNSLNVYFYLIGGGPSSGAHVVVEGSHGPKPIRMIAGSCFQPEDKVLDRYGADKVTVLAGGPGFGFFEDPACFHKALAPTRTTRLCLQLRFS